MKACTYCGRDNEESSEFCRECGTSLPTLGGIEEHPPAADDQSLTAGRVTVVFILFLVAQGLVGAVVTSAAVAIAAEHQADLRKSDEVARIVRRVLAPVVTISFGCGGVAMVAISVALARPHLRDRSPIGAAWVPGSPKAIGQGLVVGIVTGALFCALTIALPSRHAETTLDAVAKMAVTPGLSQILWLGMAIILAPLIEELLFRGILYGGYRKSFGALWAGVTTTLLFVLLHITQFVDYWPAMLGITALAMTALALRLRSAAIGPAIAVHFGYNAVIAARVIYVTVFR